MVVNDMVSGVHKVVVEEQEASGFGEQPTGLAKVCSDALRVQKTGPDSLDALDRCVWNVCTSLIACAPEYSPIHEELGDIMVSADEVALMSFLRDSKRCVFRSQDPLCRGGIESLNLAGFSLDRLSEEARRDLEQCVKVGQVQRLYLTGNALRSDCLEVVWKICSMGVLEVFLDSNIFRTVPWGALVSLSGERSMSLTHVDLSKNMISQIVTTYDGIKSDSIIRRNPMVCNSLEWIDLSGNGKLECLPDTGFFSTMPRLKRLDLHSCALRCVPKDICLVKDTLEHLSLHSNSLVELPDEITECTNLVWMSLNCNMLEKLPQSIGNLVKLQRLSLHINRLKEIPESIGKCTHIEALSLHSNDLRSIPDSIGHLQECVRLSLYHNPGLGCIPNGICQMTQLKELWMYDCGIEHVNPNIGRLRNLQKLWLDRNPFDVIADVPWQALAQLDMLQELYLDDGTHASEDRTASFLQNKKERELELKAALKHLKTLAI